MFLSLLPPMYAVFCVLLKNNEFYIENILVQNVPHKIFYNAFVCHKLLQNRKPAIYVQKIVVFTIIVYTYQSHVVKR